jgi:hypothetical protein
MVTDDHVAPPSLVITAKAAAVGDPTPAPLGPTATQSVAEEHDTLRNTPVPPSTKARVHD